MEARRFNRSDITRGFQRGVGTARLRWAGLDGIVGCCGVVIDRVLLRGFDGLVWSGRVVAEWLRWVLLSCCREFFVTSFGMTGFS